MSKSGNAKKGQTKFGSTDAIIRWLLQSEIGDEINEILFVVDPGDAFINVVILDATAPDGGAEVETELSPANDYIVLALPKRATSRRPGIHCIPGLRGGEAG